MSRVWSGIHGQRQKGERVRAAFYRNKSRIEVRNMRSDLAAKQYAGRNGFDGIEIDNQRCYVLSQAEGRRWLGPYNSDMWDSLYFGVRRHGAVPR